MPLLHFDLSADVPPEQRDRICDAAHGALVRSLGIDPEDRFQVVTVHGPGELKFSVTFPSVDRRQVLFIRILATRKYDDQTKAAMFRAIADDLTATGVRRDDIFVALTENGRADWYAGAP